MIPTFYMPLEFLRNTIRGSLPVAGSFIMSARLLSSMPCLYTILHSTCISQSLIIGVSTAWPFSVLSEHSLNLSISLPDLVPHTLRASLAGPQRKAHGELPALLIISWVYRLYLTITMKTGFFHINPIVPHAMVMVLALSPSLTVRKAPLAAALEPLRIFR